MYKEEIPCALVASDYNSHASFTYTATAQGLYVASSIYYTYNPSNLTVTTTGKILWDGVLEGDYNACSYIVEANVGDTITITSSNKAASKTLFYHGPGSRFKVEIIDATAYRSTSGVTSTISGEVKHNSWYILSAKYGYQSASHSISYSAPDNSLISEAKYPSSSGSGGNWTWTRSFNIIPTADGTLTASAAGEMRAVWLAKIN